MDVCETFPQGKEDIIILTSIKIDYIIVNIKLVMYRLSNNNISIIWPHFVFT